MPGNPRRDVGKRSTPFQHGIPHPRHESSLYKADVRLIGRNRPQIAEPILRSRGAPEGEDRRLPTHPNAVGDPNVLPCPGGVVALMRRLGEFDVGHGFGNDGSTGKGSDVQFAWMAGEPPEAANSAASSVAVAKPTVPVGFCCNAARMAALQASICCSLAVRSRSE